MKAYLRLVRRPLVDDAKVSGFRAIKRVECVLQNGLVVELDGVTDVAIDYTLASAVSLRLAVVGFAEAIEPDSPSEAGEGAA